MSMFRIAQASIVNSPVSFEPYELIITYDAHLNLIWDIVPGLFIRGDNDRYSPLLRIHRVGYCTD